jgi:hypothetical protein
LADSRTGSIRLAVEELEERPRPTLVEQMATMADPTPETIPTAPQPTPSPPSEPGDRPPAPYKADTLEVMATAFAALGYALSARAILMLAVVGGFILGVLAVLQSRWEPLIALALYAALVVIPCAVLEYRRRER